MLFLAYKSYGKIYTKFQILYEGSVIEIECPSVLESKWTKDGYPIRHYNRSNNGIKLFNAMVSDSGSYLCIGTNDSTSGPFMLSADVLVGSKFKHNSN